MTGFGLNIVVPKRKLGHNSFNQIFKCYGGRWNSFLDQSCFGPLKDKFGTQICLKLWVLHHLFKTYDSFFG